MKAEKTKIKFSAKLLIFFGLAIALGVFGFSQFQNAPSAKAVTTNKPTIHIQFGDSGNVHPNLTRGPGSQCENYLGGMGPSTTDNNDPDCLRVQMVGSSDPYHDVYTEDFRFCLRMNYNATHCTPWASEGHPVGQPWSRSGAFSGNYNGNLAGTMYATVESRPVTEANLPAGTTFTHVYAGVQLYYQRNNNACLSGGSNPGPAFTYDTQASPWAFGYNDDNDPGCFETFLASEMVAAPDAEFVSSTIPATMDAGVSYNNKYNVVMKNKGMTWDADKIVRATDSHCDRANWDYSTGPCNDYQILSSDRFRLKRSDTTPVIVKSKALNAGEMTYENGTYNYSGPDTTIDSHPNDRGVSINNTIPFYVKKNITYTRIQGQTICTIVFNSEQSYKSLALSERIFNLFLKTAQAARPPPGEGDPEDCIPTTYDYIQETYTLDPETGDWWNPNITAGENATFAPINITAPNSNGSYTLKFKMVDLNNLNSGAPYDNGSFGTEGDVIINVGGDNGGITCTATQSPVPQGQNADYIIAATGTAMTGSYNVTMASNPNPNPAPTMTNSPLVLNAGNTYTGHAIISTTQVTPGPYTLTFIAVGGTTYSCNAALEIGPPPSLPTVTLTFDGSENPPQVAPMHNGVLRWQSQNADTCTASPTEGTNWGNPSNLTPVADGNQQSGPLPDMQVYTFRVDCSNLYGSGFDTVDVPVGTTIYPPPTADLKCIVGADPASDGPCNLMSGSAGVLVWTSEETTSCEIDHNFGTNLPTNGSGSTGNLTSSITYTLTCAGPGSPGSASDSVSFIVGNTPPPPTVNLKCKSGMQPFGDGPCAVNSGAMGTITWSSSDADACSIDNGIGSVPTSPPLRGISVGPINSNTTYTITCTGPGSPPPGTDSVTFTIPPPGGGDDWDFTCTPFNVDVVQGSGGGAFTLETTKSGTFNSAVTFSTTSIIPDVSNPISVGYESNGQVPPATSFATIRASSNTPIGIYSVTIHGVGGGIPHDRTCQVTVTGSGGPTTPIRAAIDNSICGKIDVTWQPGTGGTAPDHFNIYRQIGTLTGDWGSPITTVPYGGPSQRDYSYPDTTASTSSNYYAITAVTASGVESAMAYPAIQPMVKKLCRPDLSLSDKDITQVDGKIDATFTTHQCSGRPPEPATLPNNALFSPGDKVTFRIMICNSGDGEITNVSVIDTLVNLENVTDVSSPQAGCVNGYTYHPETHTINFDLDNVPAKPADRAWSACDIVFNAVIETPSPANSSVYRFQNKAKIYANEIPAIYPDGYYEVYTLPISYSLSGGVPVRNETSAH